MSQFFFVTKLLFLTTESTEDHASFCRRSAKCTFSTDHSFSSMTVKYGRENLYHLCERQVVTTEKVDMDANFNSISVSHLSTAIALME